jgi:hypothetical protein
MSSSVGIGPTSVSLPDTLILDAMAGRSGGLRGGDAVYGKAMRADLAGRVEVDGAV